jgi:hypothetical protein
MNLKKKEKSWYDWIWAEFMKNIDSFILYVLFFHWFLILSANRSSIFKLKSHND